MTECPQCGGIVRGPIGSDHDPTCLRYCPAPAVSSRTARAEALRVAALAVEAAREARKAAKEVEAK